MSGITQLPGPGPGPNQNRNRPSPRSNLAAQTALVQPTSPYWLDPSLTMHLQQHNPPYYVPVPPQQTATALPTHPVPSTASTEPPPPRPRKPYTSTKVREMWSPAEHDRMIEGLRRYKRDWAKVTQYVGSRSAAQVRSHAQKYFDKVTRNKTDDYIPRARPKRKSAAPYPRKVRDDATPANPSTHAPVPPTRPVPLPIPVVAPLSSIPNTHPVHPASLPVQMTQSPLLSHMPSSPYMQQVAVTNIGVYPPYVPVHPHRQDPSQSPVAHHPHPHHSPVSYVNPQYSSHSPAQPIPLPQQSMYGIFSPMTPAAYPNMARSPVSMVPTPTHHVPTHSHPGGPMENCAKCAALQRYGNVFQEIGDLRAQAAPHKEAPQLAVAFAHPSPDIQAQSQAHNNAAKQTRPSTSRDSSGASSLKRYTNISATASPQLRDAPDDAAVNRANRAKLLKAKKARGDGAAPVVRKSAVATAERTSESELSADRASTASIPHQKLPNATTLSKTTADTSSSSEKASPNPTKSRSVQKRIRGTIISKSNQDDSVQRTPSPVNRVEKILKRPRQSTAMPATKKKKSSESNPAERTRKAKTASPSGSEKEQPVSSVIENSGKNENGSPVKSYPPSVQKEIFDAVHSLQILSKTSSSMSPSSETNRKEERKPEA